MNLTEALDTSLPEIPPLNRDFKPKIHPHLVWREHIEGGKTTIATLVPDKGLLFRFPPEQWQLVQLFDGQRTFEEVSQLYFEQTGTSLAAEELREYAAALDEFWYKTPLEKNIALKQRLAEERKTRSAKKSKYGDVSHMAFPAWDPDRALDWLYPKLKFIYSPWFAVVSAAAFAFMLYTFYERWDEIGHDTFLFYNFREKTLRDIAEFWCLSVFVLFVHEGAHGLTCKHYGGHVHKMGFLLLYLTPAFYTDATEVYVYGKKWQRFNTVFWGAWSEIMLCSIATPIWWGTPPGSLVHEWAYKLMLITGLAVFFFNWNPLIKLDGYYMLMEALDWPNLKEESTAYVAAWVKKHIWRLPVTVPFVPQKRRLGYSIYALVSGAYCYTLLYFFARFVSNVASSYSPSWGFLVGLFVAYRIFRSRLRSFGRFMKTLYLDKQEKLQAWFTFRGRVIAIAGLVLLLFAPLWHQSVEGRFLLEPAERAVVRAEVPGYVEAVYVEEGQHVDEGAPLARLSNLSLETKAARLQADAQMAGARATEAELRWTDVGRAQKQRHSLLEQSRSESAKLAKLDLVSPRSGVVVTPRVHDLLGSYVTEGTEIAEVADVSRMRARIYVPEFEVREATVGAQARLVCDSSIGTIPGLVVATSPAATAIEPGLVQLSSFKGIRVPNFYVYEILVENPNRDLMAGMPGTARIYGKRRSLAAFGAEAVWDFVRRKVW